MIFINIFEIFSTNIELQFNKMAGLMMQETSTKKVNSEAHLPYYRLGGEQGIKSLCQAFYEIMDILPEAKEIRAMHGKSLVSIENKLFEYLSGWLGGPHLYLEKYGSICLTSPHKPYQIDEQARDQWLLCMDKALEKIKADEETKAMLKQPMYDIANFIRNC